MYKTTPNAYNYDLCVLRISETREVWENRSLCLEPLSNGKCMSCLKASNCFWLSWLYVLYNHLFYRQWYVSASWKWTQRWFGLSLFHNDRDLIWGGLNTLNFWGHMSRVSGCLESPWVWPRWFLHSYVWLFWNDWNRWGWLDVSLFLNAFPQA